MFIILLLNSLILLLFVLNKVEEIEYDTLIKMTEENSIAYVDVACNKGLHPELHILYSDVPLLLSHLIKILINYYSSL